MKKITSLLLALLMLMGMMAIPTMAEEDVKVYLFGEKLEFDVPAQIVNGRTLVPMRKIFEELGATVDWNNDTRTVTSVREGKTIILTIDSYVMYVDGTPVTLDVAPCIVDSRTLVPARAVSESFDLKVDWDGYTRSVLITKREENVLDKEIVATIGGYPITRAYYNTHYYVMYSQYSQYAMYYGENWLEADVGNGMTIAEAIDYDAKSQIELLATAAAVAKKTYGINLDSVKSVVDNYMAETVASYSSRSDFESFLAQVEVTEEGLRTYFGMYEIFNLLLEKTSEDGKVVRVSDSEVKALFDEEYNGKIKVQHILIATESLDGYSPSKTDAEAAAIAYDVVKKLEKGEEFGKLIDDFNEDPGQTSDSYYVFGDGEMVEEFENASKNLAVGKYTTQAVKSVYGYHIIKRYPLDYTSEEYKECKMTLAQEKLIPYIQSEAEKIATQWNN